MLQVIVCLTEDSFPFFFPSSFPGRVVRSVGLGQDCFLTSQFFLSSLQCFLCHCEFGFIWQLLSSAPDPFPLPDEMVLCPKPPSQSSRHPSITVPFYRSLCWLSRPKARQSFLTDRLLNPPHQRSMPPSEALRTINFLLPSLCCSSMAVSTWSCWWT